MKSQECTLGDCNGHYIMFDYSIKYRNNLGISLKLLILIAKAKITTS